MRWKEERKEGRKEGDVDLFGCIYGGRFCLCFFFFDVMIVIVIVIVVVGCSFLGLAGSLGIGRCLCGLVIGGSLVDG